jgi:type I restriction-modification system DNA methylase subunit
MTNTSAIISKVWSYAHVLRDAGVGYGDYLEQLTYLLFLKMADEYSKHRMTVNFRSRKNINGKVWYRKKALNWNPITQNFSVN